MPPRLPTITDFPPSLSPSLTITPPPPTHYPLSILILLHGLGDTNRPFATLGTRLNLPHTACISIRGPSPVPELITGSSAPSFHWGDDIIFDQTTGNLDPDAGFAQSSKLLSSIIEILKEKCGYGERDILFFGFGQGAMPALYFCGANPTVEYGGIVSVGGKLPSSSSSLISKAKTPVLVLGGSRSGQITKSAVQKLKEVFVDVEYVKWKKGDDGMPANREEMLPIMRFFARRGRSAIGGLEGVVEVGMA